MGVALHARPKPRGVLSMAEAEVAEASVVIASDDHPNQLERKIIRQIEVS